MQDIREELKTIETQRTGDCSTFRSETGTLSAGKASQWTSKRSRPLLWQDDQITGELHLLSLFFVLQEAIARNLCSSTR